MKIKLKYSLSLMCMVMATPMANSLILGTSNTKAPPSAKQGKPRSKSAKVKTQKNPPIAKEAAVGTFIQLTESSEAEITKTKALFPDQDKALNALTSSEDPIPATADALAAVTTITAAISLDNGIVTSLAKASADMRASLKSLSASYLMLSKSDFKAASAPYPSFKSDWSKSKDLQRRLSAVASETDAKSKKLQSAASSPVTKLLATAASTLDGYVSSVKIYGAETLYQDPSHLSDFQNILTLRVSLSKQLSKLTDLLGETAKTSKSKPSDLDKADAALLSKLSGPIEELGVQTESLQSDEQNRLLKSNQILNQLTGDPVKNRIGALTESGGDQAYCDVLAKTQTAVAAILAQLGSSDCPPQLSKALSFKSSPSPLKDVALAWAAVHAAAGNLGVVDTQLAAVHDLHLDDWEHGEIRLFYFDNVANLMQYLNLGAIEKGDSTLKDASDHSHALLLQAGQDELNAQEELNNAKATLAQAESALEKAQRDVQKGQTQQISLQTGERTSISRLNASVDKAQTRANHAQEYEQITASTLATALADHNANPTDASKTAIYNRALEADNKAKLDASDAQSSLTTAQQRLAEGQGYQSQDSASSQQQITDAKANVTAAQSAVDAANSTATQAAAAVRTATSAAYVATVADNLAFAKARDASPFWYSIPSTFDGSEADPAKRVILYGAPDSRTVFIRGTESDVTLVKQLIADLDRPEAQAEVNLYSVEINSSADRKGAEKALKAESLVREHLALEQLETDAFLHCLKTVASNDSDPIPGDSGFVSFGSEDLDPISLVIKRETYLRGDLLAELHVNSQDIQDGLPASAILSVIPRDLPPNTTAEVLVKLALSPKYIRKDVYKSFQENFKRYVLEQIKNSPALHEDTKKWASCQWEKFGGGSSGKAAFFPNLMELIGPDGGSPDMRIFSNQLVDQLRDRLTEAIDRDMEVTWQDLYSLYTQIQTTNKSLNRLQQQRDDKIEAWKGASQKNGKLDIDHRIQFEREVKDSYESYEESLEELHRSEITSLNALLPLFNRYSMSARFMNRAYARAGVDLPEQMDNYHLLAIKKICDSHQLKRRPLTLKPEFFAQDWRIFTDENFSLLGNLAQSAALLDQARKKIAPPKNWFESRNARLANANGTMTRLMHAIDRDMKQGIIYPMVDHLNQSLIDESLEFGVFQRTMVLASNRLVARVDPQATAEATASAQDPLGDLAPFMQILGSAAKSGATSSLQGAAASLPGALFPPVAASATVAKGLEGTLSGIYTAANQISKKPPAAEVYGVTSGNTFQVTPIFDPTGQGMRFRLDYSLQTQIREPDGSVNPSLSRIERHSVNTEVQLSNFTMTQVSSFNVNSQLGTTPRRTGGIPILKDLYPFNEVPLIGWFTRHYLKAASSQQSLILTQTSMYPTIQDVIDLVTGQPYEPRDLSRERRFHLKR